MIAKDYLMGHHPLKAEKMRGPQKMMNDASIGARWIIAKDPMKRLCQKIVKDNMKGFHQKIATDCIRGSRQATANDMRGPHKMIGKDRVK